MSIRSKCYECKKDSENGFVGIHYDQATVKVFFPIGYRIPDSENECRESVLSLLQTISVSKNIQKNNGSINGKLSEDSSFPLSSYLWLLRDFMINGLFKAKNTILRRDNHGKISWKRTLREKPLVANSQIVYLNLYTKHDVFSDDLLTEIHIYCLKVSVEKIGWLFGDFCLPESRIIKEDVSQLICYLNSMILEAYDDHTQELISNLLTVLQSQDDAEQKEMQDYGVEGFQLVWEYVVKRLFGNVDERMMKPMASYHLYDGLVSDKIPLRLDAICKEDKSIYVLDAKYYHFGETFCPGDAPDTSDVEKQVVYGEYINRLVNSCEEEFTIYNAFIIPYNKENNPKSNEYTKDIEFVGYATVNWKQYSIEKQPFNYVGVIFLDCRFAIDNWIGSDLKNNISSLSKQILKINDFRKLKDC